MHHVQNAYYMLYSRRYIFEPYQDQIILIGLKLTHCPSPYVNHKTVQFHFKNCQTDYYYILSVARLGVGAEALYRESVDLSD